MDLYLVQHGEAKSKEDDPDRPLTERGKEQVLSVARAAKSLQLDIAAIYHSGKLRAQQSADIIAGELSPGGETSQMEALDPTDDPAAAKRAIEASDASTVLVGHLPHLTRLASLLVLGDSSREVIAFRNAAMVCLRRGGGGGGGGDGDWRVHWILTPELVAGRA